MQTADEALKALASRMFRSIPLDGGKGMAPEVLLLHGWDLPFIDAVRIRSEDDATAYRLRCDDSEDDIFAPTNVVWSLDGSVVDVIGELLELPKPGERGAPTLVISTPSSLWVPGGATKASRARYRSSLEM